jgi:hypothetical protein
MATTITWDGSEAGGVFTDDANWVGGVAPADGDSIVFDGTSDGALGNDCTINGLTISSSEQYHDITIASTYTGTITFSNTLDVRLDGALLVHKGNTLRGAGTTTFTFLGAPSVDTYDGAGAAYTKALVNFTADTSVWNAGRDTFTFNFGSQTFSMVDGAYPNITYTGEMKAKKIYSDASRTDFNNYGSVDMLNFNGDDVTSSDYDIYDYTKEYLFEGTLTTIGEYFRFGHTTARFKTLKTSSYGALNFPVTGSTNFGNTTTKNFYAQYNKLQIETNDVIDNYWKIPAGLTLECNELVIKDGGRIYGEVGTDNKAASIKCVKRPTIRGDWNFRQIADGVYETIGAFSNTPVYHGGTGRQTIPVGSILYGNGMDQVGVDTDFTYDPVEKFLEVEKVKSHIVIQVKNETGSTIPKGAAVYVDDNNTTPLVALACGDTASKMPAIGLVMEQIADNNTGYTAVNGIITISSSQIDDTLSDPADIGKILYVSATNPGKLTITKPIYSNHLIQNVGNIASISGGNVKVTISNIGRTNDTPNTALHPCFFERASIGTSAVDFRSPTVQSSTANPNAFPMPFDGRVAAATFLFAGGTITGTATNTIRIRKNGGATTKDFTFTPSDLVNTNGNNYTLTRTGADVDFDFNAGDIIQVRRESGATNLNNGQAILWLKFNNG